MLFFLSVFVAVVLGSLSFAAWRLYTDPLRVLVRQGKAMDWAVASKSKGDIYLHKDQYKAYISKESKHVHLLEPLYEKSFKDFCELDQWLLEGQSGEDDAVWGELAGAMAGAIQAVFMQVYSSENLEQYASTDVVPVEVIIKFSEAANKAASEVNVNPALILLVIHQYIDTDSEQRKNHRGDWVVFVMSRPNITPQPETYIDYMNKTYFRKRQAKY